MPNKNDLNELVDILQQALTEIYGEIGEVGEKVGEAKDLSTVSHLSKRLYGLQEDFVEMYDLIYMIFSLLKQENISLVKELKELKEKQGVTTSEKKIEFNIYHENFEQQIKDASREARIQCISEPFFGEVISPFANILGAAATDHIMSFDINTVSSIDSLLDRIKKDMGDDDEGTTGGFWIHA